MNYLDLIKVFSDILEIDFELYLDLQQLNQKYLHSNKISYREFKFIREELSLIEKGLKYRI